MPGVALILKSGLDLNNFLPLARKLLGYSPAKAADGTTVPLTEIVHQLSCLSAFKDQKAPPTVSYALPILGMFSIGFLVAIDERGMTKVLETAKGMEAVVTETLQTGLQAAVITGTLIQWKRAIKLACNPRSNLSSQVRYVFNTMYRQLVEQGLRDMFDGAKISEQPDSTFLLLEDKR